VSEQIADHDRAAAAGGSGALRVEEVMGTTVTLDIRDQLLGLAAVERAVAEAVNILHAADRTFSTYDPGSDISRLRRGATSMDRCAPEVAAVLRLCAQARQDTHGWFDPWAMPDGLDPTGLVKGWAAHGAMRCLASHGVQHATVNAGGDLVVIGNASGRYDGSGWRTGVVDPSRPDRLIDVVRGSDLAVATSGSYERGPLAIDPESGDVVQRLASATVVCPDLAFADAYATAAMAQGPSAMAWLTAVPGIRALLVTTKGDVLCHGWTAA